jgi:hypothetical protein
MGARKGDGENVEVLRDGFEPAVLDFLTDDGIGDGLGLNAGLHQVETHLVTVSPVGDRQDAISGVLIDQSEYAPVAFVVAEVGKLMIGIFAKELVILDFVAVLAVGLVVWSKISNVKSFPVTSVVIPCLLPDNSLFRFELAAGLGAA